VGGQPRRVLLHRPPAPTPVARRIGAPRPRHPKPSSIGRAVRVARPQAHSYRDFLPTTSKKMSEYGVALGRQLMTWHCPHRYPVNGFRHSPVSLRSFRTNVDPKRPGDRGAVRVQSSEPKVSPVLDRGSSIKHWRHPWLRSLNSSTCRPWADCVKLKCETYVRGPLCSDLQRRASQAAGRDHADPNVHFGRSAFCAGVTMSESTNYELALFR